MTNIQNIKDKALSLYHMISGWMTLMNIPNPGKNNGKIHNFVCFLS